MPKSSKTKGETTGFRPEPIPSEEQGTAPLVPLPAVASSARTRTAPGWKVARTVRTWLPPRLEGQNRPLGPGPRTDFTGGYRATAPSVALALLPAAVPGNGPSSVPEPRSDRLPTATRPIIASTRTRSARSRGSSRSRSRISSPLLSFSLTRTDIFIALSSDSLNQTQMGNAFLVEFLDRIDDGGLQGLDGAEGLMGEEVAFQVAPRAFDVVEFRGVYFGNHSIVSQGRLASSARVSLLTWIGPLSRT